MSTLTCSVGLRDHQVLSVLDSEVISSWTSEPIPAASLLHLTCWLSTDIHRNVDMFEDNVLLVQGTCVQLAFPDSVTKNAANCSNL